LDRFHHHLHSTSVCILWWMRSTYRLEMFLRPFIRCLTEITQDPQYSRQAAASYVLGGELSDPPICVRALSLPHRLTFYASAPELSDPPEIEETPEQ
jgi:hypothetical protein